MKISLFIFILTIIISPLARASEPSEARIAKYVKKGKKVARLFCEREKLPNGSDSIAHLLHHIPESKACKPLSKSRLIALAYFIKYGSQNSEHRAFDLEVPHDAKCPVCGMFIYKYPKWAAQITVGGKAFYFDGVKDMMKFYIFDADFPYERDHIERIFVTDFYSLHAVSAYRAFYVIGSDILGPMGQELIPFASRKEAENFKRDHGGTAILIFGQITPKIVMALDGIEFDGE